MKRFMAKCKQKERNMSALARRAGSSANAGRTPPRQPDYPDEISREQIDVVRKMTDPDGDRTDHRTELYSPAW